MQITDFHLGIRAAVEDALARAVAIAGLVSIAVIHILQTPSAFDDIGYLGGLFIAAVVACVAVAAALTRTSHRLAWAAAGGLAGVLALGYVLSRTVGLPGFTGDIGEWSEPAGLVSLVAEGLVLSLAGTVLANRHAAAAHAGGPARAAGSGMHPGPVAG